MFNKINLVEEEILQRSIKQRAISILSGLKNQKKIKNLDSGENISMKIKLKI